MIDLSDSLARGEIISNVNSLRLERLLKVVEDTDRKQGFLKSQKNLLLVERNSKIMYDFMKEFLDFFMPDYESCVWRKVPHLPHHKIGGPSIVTYMNTDWQEFEPVKVISRIKGCDSIAEKIARISGTKGIVVNSTDPSHLYVEDTYGVIVLASTREDCYNQRDLTMRSSFGNMSLLIQDKERDYFEGSKSGYCSLQNTAQWYNGDSEVNGTRLRIHFETLADYMKNKKGTSVNPQRAHACYAKDKLCKPHVMGNFQIVIIDHPGNLIQSDFREKFIDLSCRGLKGNVQYHLLRPMYN